MLGRGLQGGPAAAGAPAPSRGAAGICLWAGDTGMSRYLRSRDRILVTLLLLFTEDDLFTVRVSLFYSEKYNVAIFQI